MVWIIPGGVVYLTPPGIYLFFLFVAVVVMRLYGGDYSSTTIAKEWDQVTGTGFAGGGLIGMLVGILGGPLGMLLGWGSGALIGGVLDAGRASATNEVLGEFSRALPVDSTAVIAEVVEPSELPLDDVVSKLGGTIVRRPVSEVVAELEAAEAAAEAAQAEARRVVRERKKAEYKEALEDRKAAVEKRWEELKGKFR